MQERCSRLLAVLSSWAIMGLMTPKPAGVRARARAGFIDEIKTTAKRQLRSGGAGALSLRAVARELNVASSALYRYFPSRDELLTALISDAYADVADAAGTAVESSEGKVFVERWMTLASAIRGWAVGHTHEYALIYGSPVPGYVAPPETTEPAQRLTLALLSVLGTAASNGEVEAPAVSPSVPTAKAFDAIRSLVYATGTGHEPESGGRERQDERALTDGLLVAGVGMWTQLFGHLSFELFGQFQNVVVDVDEFFEVQMRDAASRMVARSPSVGGSR